MDQNLRDDLRLLQNQRIYFGHQSVGNNILDGLRELYSTLDVEPANILRIDSTTRLPVQFIAESLVGRNTQPDTKCRSFSETIQRTFDGKLDIALLKFCYVDFSDTTDVITVFDMYKHTIDFLKQRYPTVTFVHVTAPLTAPRTAAWKRYIKGIYGMEDKQDVGHWKRSAFNTLVRETFRNEPIFDLAENESTYPNGERNSFVYNNNQVDLLIDDYTDDGGHLNSVGRRRAAEALVRTLAEAIRTRERIVTQ